MLSVQKPVTACPFSSSLSFDASATCSHASPSNYISTATGIYPDLELDEPQQDNYPVPRPTVLFPPLSLPTPSPHQSIDAASASLLSSLISSFEITSPDGKPHSRPYFQAFSFSQLRLPRDTQREWYCVFFRSTKRLEGDRVGVDELYLADKIAYTEAVKSGGVSSFLSLSLSLHAFQWTHSDYPTDHLRLLTTLAAHVLVWCTRSNFGRQSRYVHLGGKRRSHPFQHRLWSSSSLRSMTDYYSLLSLVSDPSSASQRKSGACKSRSARFSLLQELQAVCALSFRLQLSNTFG
jgi:hypothetical protein